MEDVTPPVLHGPSSKERKYDRQLRLWAANGQAALESAHVLLINSGPGVVGIETLKNLVLPGIGQYTIIDPYPVTEQDLGINFFLTEDDLGRPRGMACVRGLNELNPDVMGHHKSDIHAISAQYYDEGKSTHSGSTSTLQAWLEQPNSLDAYTLILVVLPVPTVCQQMLSQNSQQRSIPTFYIQSHGFYSMFSVELPSAFPIVDTHPDPATTTDLRLSKPWPELMIMVDKKTAHITSMSDEEHGHIPYLLILLHYLLEWFKTSQCLLPKDYKQKSEFRELVRSGMRTNNAEGGEENWEEAIGAVLKSLNPSSPSSAVMEVFNAPEVSIDQNSPTFWVIANAVAAFHSLHGALPLPGGIPDMKAKSADYIELQNIYKAKARVDVAEVLELIRKLERAVGRTNPVDAKEVEAFCKSAGYIKLIRGTPVRIPGVDRSVSTATRVRTYANDESSLLAIHAALLGYNEVVKKIEPDCQRPLGVEDDERKPCVEEVLKAAQGIYHDFTQQESVENVDFSAALARIVRDLVQAHGAELHNISSLMGGMVAQEVIKVITQQYVPVDNTCVFDGVKSRTSVMKL